MSDTIVANVDLNEGTRSHAAGTIRSLYGMALTRYVSNPGRFDVVDADHKQMREQFANADLKDVTVEYMQEAYKQRQHIITDMQDRLLIERLLNGHVTTVTPGHMHALGRKCFGEGWDSIRPLLVECATHGEEVSSKHLDQGELERIIALLRGIDFITVKTVTTGERK